VRTPIEATFDAAVWCYPGEGNTWHFLTLPVDLADDIRARVVRTGFGSVRVTATIGDTTWATSVFPEKASGSYVLPVKKAVRQSEGLEVDTTVTVRVALVE
jgi:hypothetical protein